jgi:hypothetical protein
MLARHDSHQILPQTKLAPSMLCNAQPECNQKSTVSQPAQISDQLWTAPVCCRRTASVPRLPASKSPTEPPAAAAVAAPADETAGVAAQQQQQQPATPHSRLSPVSARSQVPPCSVQTHAIL